MGERFLRRVPTRFRGEQSRGNIEIVSGGKNELGLERWILGNRRAELTLTDKFAQTWGFMVEKVIAHPIVLVSTTDDRIEMFSPTFVIQINGGLPVSYPVGQPVSFTMTVKDGKATNWVGLWDQGDAEMNDAIAKVTAALEAAKTSDA